MPTIQTTHFEDGERNGLKIREKNSDNDNSNHDDEESHRVGNFGAERRPWRRLNWTTFASRTPVICDHNYARQEYLSIYLLRTHGNVAPKKCLSMPSLPYFVGTRSIYALLCINLMRTCLCTAAAAVSMCQINELNQKLETIMFV